MNIRQYYEQAASVSLNASLAALIPAMIILFYSIVIVNFYPLLLLIIPFLIYSFFSYQAFLLHKNRAEAIDGEALMKELTPVSLMETPTLLIHFLPAPSLRLLFFHPTGIKAGELRDGSMIVIRWFLPFFIDRFSSRRFILYDHQDKPLAYFYLEKDRMEIKTKEETLLTTVYQLKKEKGDVFLMDDTYIHIVKNGIPADYSFITEDKSLFAHIQSGIMPLEWGKRFINPNTPILTIPETSGVKERYQLMALLIFLYRYANH